MVTLEEEMIKAVRVYTVRNFYQGKAKFGERESAEGCTERKKTRVRKQSKKAEAESKKTESREAETQLKRKQKALLMNIFAVNSHGFDTTVAMI